MVARALGRHGVHVDLSADYNRLAHWRITNLDQLAAVQGHQRTKRQPDNQPTLLDALEDPA